MKASSREPPANYFSVLVFLADTWLHVTTSSTEIVLTTPMSTSPKYGFGLLPKCTLGSTITDAGSSPTAAMEACAVSMGSSIFFTNPTNTYAVLGNLSTTMTAAMFQDDRPFVYMGVPKVNATSRTDYKATTYALQTACTPVSRECNLVSLAGASTAYHCNSIFEGNLAAEPWKMMYFSDATLSDNDTDSGVGNPFYFGWAALLNGGGGGNLYNSDSPQLVRNMHGGDAVVLACNTTVFDVEYTSVNNTIVQWASQMSNVSVANIVQGPLAKQTGDSRATPYLQYHSSIAMFSDSVQGLADYMALSYSKAALSFFASTLLEQDAVHAEERASMLVARVPIAPLLALVVANLLFVVAGIVLLAIALLYSDGRTKDVQSRLSIAGLVSHAFEARHDMAIQHTQELFEESDGKGSTRIGLLKMPEGGYAYKAISDATGFRSSAESHRLLR